jgi:hypothetical protein
MVYKDEEVIGVDKRGVITQWYKNIGQYTSGDTLEEFGVDNLSQIEKKRLLRQINLNIRKWTRQKKLLTKEA